jgi:hypothetical protein
MTLCWMEMKFELGKTEGGNESWDEKSKQKEQREEYEFIAVMHAGKPNVPTLLLVIFISRTTATHTVLQICSTRGVMSSLQVYSIENIVIISNLTPYDRRNTYFLINLPLRPITNFMLYHMPKIHTLAAYIIITIENS